jgi:hypothetical protein
MLIDFIDIYRRYRQSAFIQMYSYFRRPVAIINGNERYARRCPTREGACISFFVGEYMLPISAAERENLFS